MDAVAVKLVECSDYDVIYGIFILKNVTAEELQAKIYEIKNDEKFLKENPDWCIDDVLALLPDEWDYEYYSGSGETVDIYEVQKCQNQRNVIRCISPKPTAEMSLSPPRTKTKRLKLPKSSATPTSLML